MSRKSVDKSPVLSEIIYRLNVENSTFIKFDNQDEFDRICKGLEIIPYVELQLKKSYIGMYLMKLHITQIDLDDPLALAIEQEKLMLVDLLLNAYTNVDTDIDEFTSDQYDTLMRSGLIDYILSICGKDYQRMLHLVDEQNRIEKMFAEYKMFNSFNISDLEEVVNKMTQAFDNLDAEKLEHIDSIVTANDPKFKKFKDEFIITETKTK